MPATVFENSIAWAHFKLRGGWKNTFFFTGGYLMLLGLAVVTTSRFSTITALRSWTSILLGIQFLMLGLYGSSVIGSAIRRDITSGLMESHRLMPMSPVSVVMGYILGPSFQPLLLGFANVLVGCGTSAAAGLPLSNWIMANIIVLIFVLFIWVVVAHMAFLAKNATGLVMVLTSVSGASGGFVLAAIPGLMILVTPLTGRSVFGLLDASQVLSRGYAFSFVGQTAIGAIFFAGAIRKYRRPDAPALGSLLGFLLLGVWVGLSVVGILVWEDFVPRFMRGELPDGVQMVASLIVAMLLALIPVVSTARNAAEWRLARLHAGSHSLRRPLAPPLAILVATAVVLVLAAACLPVKPTLFRPHEILAQTGIVVLSFLAFIGYLIRILLRATKKLGVMLAFVLILWCLLPFGIDMVRHAAASNYDATLTAISTVSPIGALVSIWTLGNIPFSKVGMAMQVMIAAVPVMMFYSIAKRRSPSTTR